MEIIRMRTSRFVVIALLAVASIMHSQRPAFSQAASPSPNESARLDRLEAQFAVVRDYNDDFMSVLIWGLGTVGTIAVVLIGLNWFQSTRALRREFEVLKAELTGSVSEMSAASESKMASSLGELQKKLEASTTKVVDEKVAQLRGGLKGLKSRVLELEFQTIEQQVDHWLKTDVAINAVNTCRELIDCAVEMQEDWRISGAVDKLNESLDALSTRPTRPEAMELSELEAAVERIPASLKGAKSALLTRLSKLHK
jgi:hypothetical protein